MDQNTCPFTVYPFDKYFTKDLTPEEHKNGVYYITYETKEIESCIDIEFLLADGTISSDARLNGYTSKISLEHCISKGALYLGKGIVHRKTALEHYISKRKGLSCDKRC